VNENLPTVEDSVPLSGTDTEAVLAAIKQALDKGSVLSLTVKASEPAIRFQRIATPEEAEAKSQLSYHDIIRSKPMEEYSYSNELSPYEQIFDMFSIVEDAGFVPAVMISGRNVIELRKWLKRLPRRAKTVYGATLIISDQIPEDNLILCGCREYNIDPESIEFSVKMTLP